MNQAAQLMIFEADSGQVQVRLEGESVWLRQEQMSQLFGRERSVITKHLRNVLKAQGRPRAIVEVTLTDDDDIRAMNREWRKVDSVTDVLSFALQEGEAMPGAEELLGDVVVSLDTAARQAAQMAREHAETHGSYGLYEKVAFLATHGVLHLLGYDHIKAADAAVMEALESELMAPITSAPLHALDRTDHATDATIRT